MTEIPVDVPAQWQVINFSHGSPNDGLVWLVHPDEAFVAALSDQLFYFGYQVRGFSDLATFQQQFVAGKQVVLLIASSFSEAEDGLAVAQRMCQQCAALSVVILSDSQSLSHHLRAVRLGARAFLPAVPDVASLLDCLQELAASNEQVHHRILVISESDSRQQQLSGFFSSHDTFQLQSVQQLSALLQHMQDFNPDLLLMDTRFSECHASEVTAVIRQKKSWSALPVIYLSDDMDQQQMPELVASGDGMLLPPFTAEALLKVVRNALYRAQQQRIRMALDVLTGTYTHSAIRNQLLREVARAQRSRQPLSFALIDLDGMDRVNRRFGLAMGDQMIKRLSQLLKQRLRTTDLIGRYAGEEFAVVLVNCSAEQALTVLQDICNKFSRLKGYCDEEVVTMTVSIGISDMTQATDVDDLVSLAELGMNQVKQQGGNGAYYQKSSDWEPV